MIQNRLSVIIPSRNEQFLPNTIDDLAAKATGDVEIIAILDGYWPDPPLKNYNNLVIIHRGAPVGMRPAINAGLSVATGEYIMKCDAHCMFAEGYDKALIENIDDNWISVPTRKRLDAENWRIQEVNKPDINYCYLSFPNNPMDFGGKGLHARLWNSKNADKSLESILIDDLMSFQGSCWFAKKSYVHQLELMDTERYGAFWKEAQEIGLKAWLSGGRVVRNKTTWYAHLHKGKKYGRGYFLDKRDITPATQYTNKWIFDSAWEKQTLPFAWLIEKFWPVPEWTEDWKEKIYEHITPEIQQTLRPDTAN